MILAAYPKKNAAGLALIKSGSKDMSRLRLGYFSRLGFTVGTPC